jgi:hypothetical protein
MIIVPFFCDTQERFYAPKLKALYFFGTLKETSFGFSSA